MGGWKTVRVADIAARSSNAMATGPFGSSIGSKFFRSSGVPVIRGGNLSADSAIRINDENLVFLTPEKAAEFSRSTVHRGDLIFTSWGTINQVGLIDGSASFDTYIISNKQMKLTPDPHIALPEFLYYMFSGPAMQREILEGSIGTSVPGFNLTRLKSIEIQLPPIEEQQQIARALSDAEGLEKTVSDLIAKRQAIKQGMMQQLLSGRTRLPGFNGEWKPQLLRTNGSTYAGLTGKSKPDFGVGQARFVTFLDVIYNARIRTPNLERVRVRPTERQNQVIRGDVLFNCSSETPEEVALSAVVEFEPAPSTYLNSFCFGYRLKEGAPIDPTYLAYFFRASPGRALVASLAQGATRYNIAKTKFLELAPLLPPIDEQDAIIRILHDADNEIVALQTRLDKARAIKTGMMQQLLSGRTRLPVQEATA